MNDICIDMYKKFVYLLPNSVFVMFPVYDLECWASGASQRDRLSVQCYTVNIVE